MEHLGQKLPFIIIAITFWILYMLYIWKRKSGIFSYWGFRKENLKESFKFIAPLAGISILSFLIIGYFSEQAIFSWHILPILLVYPIWGIIQQFLIMSLFAGNLQDQSKFKLPKFSIVLSTSLLFGLVHLPYTLLAFGTGILALVYTYTFLKYRNLWWLGFFHGVLGAFFYYWVLGRDTFEEVFFSTI